MLGMVNGMSKSSFITAHGFQQLSDELTHLLRNKRPEITRAVSEAAALGDRSENAEYIYGKKLLREVDRRIRFLQNRLPDLQVIRHKPDNTAKVYFGAWVSVENSDGLLTHLRIVGCDEINPAANHISIDAPMARALLGKSVDDEVRVLLPSGSYAYYVVTAIKYE